MRPVDLMEHIRRSAVEQHQLATAATSPKNHAAGNPTTTKAPPLQLSSSSSMAAPLELNQTVRFRRRTRSHPFSFDDFLAALSDRRISWIECHGEISFGLTSDEWHRLVSRLAGSPHIRRLEFRGFRTPNVVPIPALVEALRRTTREEAEGSCGGLEHLSFGDGVILFGAPEEFAEFCDGLARAPCLGEFVWEGRLRLQNTRSSMDPLFEALARNPGLRSVTISKEATLPTSAAAVRTLCRHTANQLVELTIDSVHWGTVGTALSSVTRTTRPKTTKATDTTTTGIRRLTLWGHNVPESDVESLIASLSNIPTLEELHLNRGIGFSDASIAGLLSAIPTHSSLRRLTLSDESFYLANTVWMSLRGFQTLEQLVQRNHHLEVDISMLSSGLHNQVDNKARIRTIRKSIAIETELNRAGRSRVATKARNWEHEWLRVFQKLHENKDREILLDCLYKLLQVEPSICQQQQHAIV